MQMKIRNSFIILLSAVIAVLLLSCAFMLAPKTTAHADSEEMHDHSTMTELATSGELTTGAYYLGDNINGNITVTGEVTLCLNGKTVTGSGNGSVITVRGGATFTLCDCVGTGIITGGNADQGGGVYVDGTFTMTGGTISGNKAEYGGGVYVVGTFEIKGAPNITGNKVNGVDDNVSMDLSTITVTGELTEGAQIGVKYGMVATGYKQNDKPSKFFIPDNYGDCVYVSDENSGTVTIACHALSDITKWPTCTEAGVVEGLWCLQCGYYATEKVETPALGHKYGEWTVVKEATETEEGEERRVCENDNTHYETRAIPKLTPSTPETPSAPAKQKKSYVWICWLLIPLAIAVGGITLGIWVYEKDKRSV